MKMFIKHTFTYILIIFILLIININLINVAYAKNNDYESSRIELITSLKKKECIFEEYCKNNNSNYEKTIIYINDVKRQFNEEYLKYGSNKKVQKITKESLKNIIENLNTLNECQKFSFNGSSNNYERYKEIYTEFISNIQKHENCDSLECIYLNDVIVVNDFMCNILETMILDSNTLEIKKMCCEYDKNIHKETNKIKKLLKNNDFGE